VFEKAASKLFAQQQSAATSPDGVEYVWHPLNSDVVVKTVSGYCRSTAGCVRPQIKSFNDDAVACGGGGGGHGLSSLDKVECRLEAKQLWDKFYDLGTEMIITKSGRLAPFMCNQISQLLMACSRSVLL
jgi:T-box